MKKIPQKPLTLIGSFNRQKMTSPQLNFYIDVDKKNC